MFTVNSQKSKVVNFNPRSEKHGDDNVLAGDIKIEMNCHASALDAFEPALRPLLFRQPAAGEQPTLQFGDQTDFDGNTALRAPHLAPLKWDEDFPGYTLTITEGMGLQDPLVLDMVELSSFTFEAIEGGSVKISFRASCHPDAEQSGQLCELIQEDVELTLTPPAKPELAIVTDNEAFENKTADELAQHEERTRFAA